MVLIGSAIEGKCITVLAGFKKCESSKTFAVKCLSRNSFPLLSLM